MKRLKFDSIKHNNRRAKILIIDDLTTNIEIVASILAPEGFILLYAQSGKDGINIAKNEKPDLILLDIMMPDLDGIETCKVLKENKETCSIPIIFLTAKTDDETLFKSFDAGGFDYITKPFSAVTLLARIYNQLRFVFKQEELNETQKRLIKAHKIESLSLLAGGIAHDFNNQLNGIIGFADLIKDKTDNDKIHKLSEMIVQCGDRCSQLTNKLLAFAGKGKYLTTKINIELIINTIEKLIQQEHPEIKIIKEFKAKNPIVNGDYIQIENVIQEIINNALDSMQNRNNPVLTFILDDIVSDMEDPIFFASSADTKYYLNIKIIDTGTGIKKENLDKIFDPFFTTKDLSLGAGMSLAAVYGIIENHNGNIKIDSNINKGTTVSITLPSEKINSNVKIACTQQQKSTKKEVILVADTNKLNRILLEDIINSKIRKVITTANNPDTIIEFKKNIKDINTIFIDFYMAIKNNNNLIKELIETKPEIIIYIITSYETNDINELNKLSELGIKDFVSKPLKHKNILALLDNTP